MKRSMMLVLPVLVSPRKTILNLLLPLMDDDDLFMLKLKIYNQITVAEHGRRLSLERGWEDVGGAGTCKIWVSPGSPLGTGSAGLGGGICSPVRPARAATMRSRAAFC